jgi:dipeptidyl-peptidase 9
MDQRTNKKRSWSQLRSLVDYSRRLSFSLNTDIPSNIKFRQYGPNEQRVYYLADDLSKRQRTIKYITINPNQLETNGITSNLLINTTSTTTTTTTINNNNNDNKLTKEEQLLRERQRQTSNGITSFQLDDNLGRFLYRERSDLYYYDDNNTQSLPIKIDTHSKGTLDIKTCPYNSNLISYIINGDIWIQDLSNRREIRLTNSSYEVNVTRGVPSYIIQEEFDRYTGYWWQPVQNASNNKHYIIYEVVDDNQVDKTLIVPSCDDPFGCDTYRYTKPGMSNSRVHLELVEFSLETNEIRTFKMRKSFYDLFNWYEYLVRCDWILNGKFFWVQLLNRLQTCSSFYLIPIEFFTQTLDANLIELYSQQSDVWINSHNIMKIVTCNGPRLDLITANDETGYLHLYYYQIALDSLDQLSEYVCKVSKLTRTQLTDGDWTIEHKENINFDSTNGLVYFMAYVNPLESQLYCVSLNEPLKLKQLTKSGYSHQIAMNQDCSLFIDISSSIQTPYKAYLYQIINQKFTSLDKLNASQLAQIIMNTNDVLNNELSSFGSGGGGECGVLKVPQLFSFYTKDNCLLYGMIYYPNDYKPGQRYPTVLYIYAGPHVQLVSNSYKQSKFIRLNMLALLGYCVLVIDSRGSDYRGLKFESHIKHKMGQVEIDDQVDGLIYAADTFNCIDLTRVGIFGWSYGGYMSLMGLAQRPDIFKVAISGAPVTDWSLYDSGYTERYMGLPNEQKEAYSNGSVINRAKSFPNEENRLLIIHGMMDENVHFIHTRQLVDALIKQCKPYQLQIYPQERHGMRSSDASIHTDLNLFSFLEQYL